MMKCVYLGVGVLLSSILYPASLHAQDVRACRTIADSLQRLTCYDRTIDSAAQQASRPPEINRLLVAAMQRAGLLNTTQVRCLFFREEGQEQGRRIVGVFERHSGGCPGDPDTSPRFAKLAYDSRTGQVFQFDTAADAYRAIR